MFSYSLSELRTAEHTARTERVNREGWMRQKSATTQRSGSRRHLGDALVRLGERLQAVPAGRAIDPVTA